MLKGRLNNGVFILGIDAENVRRLKDNKPILLSLAEIGGTDDILIMYGDTIEDIEKELELVTGKPMPEPMPYEDIKKRAH